MSGIRLLLVVAIATSCLAVTGSGASAQDDDFIDIPGLGTTRIDVPRPSSGIPACDLALPGEGTIAERVARLRAAGVFADRTTLTDEQLAADLEAAIVAMWGDVPPDDGSLELLVAEQDPTRVWWRDLEADVGAGGGVYAATLAEWAAISAGAFTPTEITETWASEEGPVSVSFESGGSTHVLEPEYLEDWIDPRILEPINQLIAPSGRQFRMVKAFDQSAFVMALTEEERSVLEAGGWCFS
jgi:hypothetical protein